MSSKAYHRGRLFVDQKFQTKFILNILLLIIFIVILLITLIVLRTSKEISGSVYTKIVQLKNTNEIIIPLLIKLGLIILIIGGIFVLFNLLKYSNKIVGPLVRFKRLLKELGTGNLNIAIEFRKHDELQDLAEILTQTAKELNQKIKTVQQDFDPLYSIFIKKHLTNLDDHELKIINDKIHKIRSGLKEFKTN